jgi:hypothetical protein
MYCDDHYFNGGTLGCGDIICSPIKIEYMSEQDECTTCLELINSKPAAFCDICYDYVCASCALNRHCDKDMIPFPETAAVDTSIDRSLVLYDLKVAGLVSLLNKTNKYTTYFPGGIYKETDIVRRTRSLDVINTEYNTALKHLVNTSYLISQIIKLCSAKDFNKYVNFITINIAKHNAITEEVIKASRNLRAMTAIISKPEEYFAPTDIVEQFYELQAQYMMKSMHYFSDANANPKITETYTMVEHLFVDCIFNNQNLPAISTDRMLYLLIVAEARIHEDNHLTDEYKEKLKVMLEDKTSLASKASPAYQEYLKKIAA